MLLLPCEYSQYLHQHISSFLMRTCFLAPHSLLSFSSQSSYMPQKVLALFLGYIKSDIIMIHRLCRHQHILECLDVLLRGLFLFSLGLSSFHALNSRENCPILKPFFIQKVQICSQRHKNISSTSQGSAAQLGSWDFALRERLTAQFRIYLLLLLCHLGSSRQWQEHPPRKCKVVGLQS